MEPTATLSTETTASVVRGFAEQTPGEQLFSLAVFGLGVVMTALFAYFLVTDPARLAAVWTWTRSLPLVVQGVIWLLFLPWMVSLWFWVMPWALPIRLVLIVAALAWTNWLLWPWK